MTLARQYNTTNRTCATQGRSVGTRCYETKLAGGAFKVEGGAWPALFMIEKAVSTHGQCMADTSAPFDCDHPIAEVFSATNHVAGCWILILSLYHA